MNKRFYFSFLMSAGLFLTACSSNESEQSEAEVVTVEESSGLSIDESTIEVQWTAYKTTEKVPVKGHFRQVEIYDINEADDLAGALNGAKFKLDAFQSDTDDPDRDVTIRENFFEKMMEPGEVTGTFTVDGDEWSVKLKMNGVSVTVPAQVTVNENDAELIASLDLNEFAAIKALNFLNEACHDLHMGGDGISKTWDVVDVRATLAFE